MEHVPHASHKSSLIKRTECTPGTRVHVLEDMEDWAFSANGAPVFWLGGMAGTGKSTIAQSMCNYLDAFGMLGASFFCSRASGAGANDVRRIVPTLAYQLAYTMGGFMEELCKVLERPDRVSLPVFEQLWYLLWEPIEKISSNAKWTALPLFVVIDGLDECSDSRSVELFLQALLRPPLHRQTVDTRHIRRLRIMLVSRPEPHILNVIDQAAIPCKTLKLQDVPTSVVTADIRTHVELALEEMTHRHHWDSGWYSTHDIDFIVSQADILFIYATTALKYLADSKFTPNKRLQIIRQTGISGGTGFTRPLEMLYSTILENLGAVDDLEPFEMDLIHGVLFCLSCSLSPLRVGDISHLLGMSLGEVRACLHSLSSVALIPSLPEEESHHVKLFHASFRDFLLSSSQHLPARWRLDLRERHQNFTLRCLYILLDALQEGILGRYADRHTDVDHVPPEHISRCIPPVLQYASRHWIAHMLEASMLVEGSVVVPDVPRLLSEFTSGGHLLPWIESLAWTRDLTYVMRLLRRVETLNSQTVRFSGFKSSCLPWLTRCWQTPLADSNLNQILRDVSNLLRQSHELISVYPMEVYYSALIWLPQCICPTLSIERQKRELPVVLRGLHEAWPVSELTIDAEVESALLSVSPGDQYVALISLGNIRIWSLETGFLEAEINPNTDGLMNYTTLAFLDDFHLALGVAGRGIEVWDIRTQNRMQAYQTPFSTTSDLADSLYFSKDSSTLVSFRGSHMAIWRLDEPTMTLSLLSQPSVPTPSSETDVTVLAVCILSPSLLRCAFMPNSQAEVDDSPPSYEDFEKSETAASSTVWRCTNVSIFIADITILDSRSVTCHLMGQYELPGRLQICSSMFSKDGDMLMIDMTGTNATMRFRWDDLHSQLKNHPHTVALRTDGSLDTTELHRHWKSNQKRLFECVGSTVINGVLVHDMRNEYIWETRAPELPRLPLCHSECNNSNKVVSWCTDGMIRVWTIPDSEPMSPLTRMEKARSLSSSLVTSDSMRQARWLSMLPNPQAPMVTALNACLWDARTDTEFHTPVPTESENLKLASNGIFWYSQRSRALTFSRFFNPAFGLQTPSFQTWDIFNGEPIDNNSISMAVSLNGEYVVVRRLPSPAELELCLVDVQASTVKWLRESPQPRSDTVQYVEQVNFELIFSPDATLLAAYSEQRLVTNIPKRYLLCLHAWPPSNSIFIFHTASGAFQGAIDTEHHVHYMCFSPDNTFLVTSSSWMRRGTLYNLNTGHQMPVPVPQNEQRENMMAVDLRFSGIAGWEVQQDEREDSHGYLCIPSQSPHSVHRVSTRNSDEHVCWVPVEYRSWYEQAQILGSHLFLSSPTSGVIVLKVPPATGS